MSWRAGAVLLIAMVGCLACGDGSQPIVPPSPTGPEPTAAAPTAAAPSPEPSPDVGGVVGGLGRGEPGVVGRRRRRPGAARSPARDRRRPARRARRRDVGEHRRLAGPRVGRVGHRDRASRLGHDRRSGDRERRAPAGRPLQRGELRGVANDLRPGRLRAGRRRRRDRRAADRRPPRLRRGVQRRRPDLSCRARRGCPRSRSPRSGLDSSATSSWLRCGSRLPTCPDPVPSARPAARNCRVAAGRRKRHSACS